MLSSLPRRFMSLALFAILAGCASPDEPAAPETGPIDLGDRLGLFLVDVEARTVTILAERPGLAWISEGGTFVTFTDDVHAVVIDRSTGARGVAAVTAWARIHDNGTGLFFEPNEAVVRQVAGTTVFNRTPVRDTPVPGAVWTSASADLSLLAGEFATGAPGSRCSNDLVVGAERYVGCHLAVAPDGRAGWTNGTAAWVRAVNGTVTPIASMTQGDRFVAHENPVFTENGTMVLRLTGGSTLEKTEVVGPDGEILIENEGPARLALHGTTRDARLVLLRAFAG